MALTEFGKAIRKARIEKEISLSLMAHDLGTTPAFLSAMETGRKKIPNDWIAKIQRYFKQKHLALPTLPELADVANRSVSLDGLSPAQQMLVAGFARRTMDDSQLAAFRELLSTDRSDQ